MAEYRKPTALKQKMRAFRPVFDFVVEAPRMAEYKQLAAPEKQKLGRSALFLTLCLAHLGWQNTGRLQVANCFQQTNVSIPSCFRLCG